MFAGKQVKAQLFQPGAPELGVFKQLLAQGTAFFDKADGLEPGSNDGGRQRIGEQIGPRPLPQQVDHWLRPSDITADAPPKCFAQSPGEDIHIHPKMIRRTRPVWPHKAGGMAIIHHDHGVILIGQGADLRQFRQIAIHREHPIGGDHDMAGTIGARLFKPGFQVVHIAVEVAVAFGLAQAHAVDNGRMIQTVRDNGVLWPQEGLEQPTIGVKTGRKQDGVIFVQKLGQTLLQLSVNILGAADKADRGHAEALVIHDASRGCDQIGVIRQAKVVIGTKVDDLFVAHGDLAPLWGGDHSFPLIEPIGLDLGERLRDVV